MYQQVDLRFCIFHVIAIIIVFVSKYEKLLYVARYVRNKMLGKVSQYDLGSDDSQNQMVGLLDK